MKEIAKIHVTSEILNKTATALKDYGQHGCEGLVLWLGHIENTDTCYVKKVITPPQNSIKSEEGVGYFVTSETLFALNKYLSTTGLRLLAQVHSHPGRAYHSAADDRYCIITVEGGFSIVVPNFGFGPLDLQQWATYRLQKSVWQKLSASAIRSIFVLDGKSIPSSSPNDGLASLIKKLFC